MEKVIAKYETFANYAGKIEAAGAELYKLISDSYKKLEDLHSDDGWKGVRYVDLVKSFNKITSDLNDMIQDVQYGIPNALRTMGTNYGNFDTGSFSSGSSADASKITDIPEPQDNYIAFVEEVIESAKQTVSDNFSTAKDKITAAKQTIIDMNSNGDWIGAAQQAYEAKLSTYETKIHSSLDSLISDYEKAMSDTINDMNATENANTVN